MSAEKKIKVKIGDNKYTLVSDDDYLEQLKRGFEPDMVRLFKSLVRADDYVLDIGANIGCTALLFGSLAAQVFAFEPSPSTYRFLQRNIAGSGLLNIKTYNLGLGEQAGETTLTFSPTNRSGGFVSDKIQAMAGYSVEKITIQPLDLFIQSLNLPRVDLIKIDVEGFEGSVLRGARWLLDTYRPIVVLGLNHWCLNAFQRTSIPDFFDFLRSLFPRLLAIDGQSYLDLHDESESYTVMYHHILQMRFRNIVAAFDDRRLNNFLTSYHHTFKA